MNVALTKLRFINALRCYTNYALSLFGLVRSTHMPLFVSVEPAAVCQLRCPECPVGQRTEKGTKGQGTMYKGIGSQQSAILSREVWERTLREVAPTAMVMQFYFQGEPLLNSHLPQMIREAHEAGLYTIVSTNGQAMSREMAEELVQAGLNRIIISMDGMTEASYNAYRVGGSLEKTKAALRLLREAKEKFKMHKGQCIIELQCLRLKTNEHEWSAFRRQYKALGADRLVFKTAQLYDYQQGHPLMPSEPRYSRYRMGPDGKYHRRALRRGCLRVWSGCVITTTGEVLPCCYDKEHAHAYGNIMEQPLSALFANEQARAFRLAALSETPQICQECYK